ncbi:DUF460 domain-containing protein, partial [Acidianus sp. RZ1]|uniref:DUF460 domain-containing protein n=1 Tax=Acidianus sp. RZ1 TaxID=1540082 RepID=UPI0014911B0A
HDLKVDIRPVYKSRIEFEVKRRVKKPLIVGIDPGLEVGISIIDIHGNPITLTTKRSIDREEIISLISEKGNAVIIATDVYPPPDAVKKISGILKAKIYYPEKSMSVEEKQELLNYFCSKFGLSITDVHIRDSLAAALKAYRELERKLNQTSSILERLDLDLDNEAVYRCVIEGNTIAECVEKEIEKKIDFDKNNIIERKVVQENRPKSQRTSDYDILMLRHENNRLRRTISALFKEKYILEKRIDELKSEFNVEIQRDRKVYQLTLEIEQKNKEIENLNKYKNNLENESKKLREVIENLVDGKATIIRNHGIIHLENGKIKALEEEINPAIVEFMNNEIIIVDNTLIRDLKTLEKEKENNIEIDNKKMKNIIDEYRKEKLKHGNFTV